jgi:hypothetical protein
MRWQSPDSLHSPELHFRDVTEEQCERFVPDLALTGSVPHAVGPNTCRERNDYAANSSLW